jgi:2-polyprenyl-3-methyl-5-hydroxy-6-metoxy-1,4-benzoquinol methylase
VNAVMLGASHYLRKLLYVGGPIGRAARKARSLVRAHAFDRGYWDSTLVGKCAPYLGGTLSIDARNALVAMLLKHHALGATSLLDIGCAGGTLADVLGQRFSTYTGVDISDVAVRAAAQRTTRPGCRFFASDMTTYEPDQAADVIVFNEVLYYVPFDRILAELDRYLPYLTVNGVVCISLKHTPQCEAICSRISKHWPHVCSMLYQEKMVPEHRVRLNRERPAYLISLWRPHAST